MVTTAVIPFWNGPNLNGLLNDLGNMPVVIVQDAGSSSPQYKSRSNIKLVGLQERGYFAGAVNAGAAACNTDILILNQDVRLAGDMWRELVAIPPADIFGDGIFKHPAWPSGYVQGTFMYISQTAWDKVGVFNQRMYPLWGCTAEWQLRAARNGFDVKPMQIPGLSHAQRAVGQVGNAISRAMQEEPSKRYLFVQTPPAISVVVPCFNYGRFLQDAINSLMAQTFQSFEVVIVDDASTDDSWSICERLANPMAGIRAIRHAQNKGTAAALNTAIRNSHGRFVTVLSADDMFMPRRLEVLYRASMAHPNSVIYDDILWRTHKGDSIVKMHEYYFDDLIDNNEPGMLVRNAMHAGIMFSRKAWERVGGYPEIMRDGREDWAFNLALGRAGYCGFHVNEPLYIYRRQKQNRSLRNTTPEYHQTFLAKLRGLFPDIYSGRYPAMCCGSGRGAKAKKPAAKKPLAPGVLKMDAPKGMVKLRYVGRNNGTETWYGRATGAVYKFGLSARRQNGFVHEADVPALLETKLFTRIRERRGRKPEEAKPLPAIDTEEARPMTDKLVELDATQGAIQYAEEMGINLADIEKRGGRITKKDIEDYVRRTRPFEIIGSGAGNVPAGATS